ncbi:MAG: hypothetical protein K6G45_07600 [Lachnospiraceae bacterium]|nr:hypothetical protein [Lachnospiraceae bacterium]
MCDSSACSILLTDFEERKCRILCVDHDDSFSMENDDVVSMEEFIDVAETWRALWWEVFTMTIHMTSRRR